MPHAGAVPQLATDRFGVPKWDDVPAGAYRIVTFHDGALTGRDTLVQKRHDGTATLFLLPPTKKAVRKALVGLGNEPTPLVKKFSDALPHLNAAESAGKQAAVAKRPTDAPRWTNAQPPTHILHAKRPDGTTSYIPLHAAPPVGMRVTKVGTPTNDPSKVAIQDGNHITLTPPETQAARTYTGGITSYPSLALKPNPEQAQNQRLPVPDFNMRDMTGRPPAERLADLEQHARTSGMVTSDHPDFHLMGIAPTGDVYHVSLGGNPRLQYTKRSGELGSNAYGEHTNEQTGDYPDRGHADRFLADAIHNPAWVTERDLGGGRLRRYIHIYPRGPGKNDNLGREAPGGLTFVANKVQHPDFPHLDNQWNLFNVITNQSSAAFYPTRDKMVARSHALAEENRGPVATDESDIRRGRRPLGGVRYRYLNLRTPPQRNK